MAMLGEQYEQTIAEMLQKQSVSKYDRKVSLQPKLYSSQIHLDEAQEHESTQLGDRLQHELDILTAYQSKSRMAADSQRTRERRELEVRIYIILLFFSFEQVNFSGACVCSTCSSWTEDGGGEFAVPPRATGSLINLEWNDKILDVMLMT